MAFKSAIEKNAAATSTSTHTYPACTQLHIRCRYHCNWKALFFRLLCNWKARHSFLECSFSSYYIMLDVLHHSMYLLRGKPRGFCDFNQGKIEWNIISHEMPSSAYNIEQFKSDSIIYWIAEVYPPFCSLFICSAILSTWMDSYFLAFSCIQ